MTTHHRIITRIGSSVFVICVSSVCLARGVPGDMPRDDANGAATAIRSVSGAESSRPAVFDEPNAPVDEANTGTASPCTSVIACPSGKYVTTTAVDRDWTDDIWGLPDGDYPDNDGGVPGLCACLDGAAVTLNGAIKIDGLQLINSATLKVVGADSEDLTIQNGGGINLEGRLLVDHNRVIDAPGGEVRIGELGKYTADPTSDATVTARLTAGSLVIEPTLCGEVEQLSLSDSMSVEVSGDLLMDGTTWPGTVCPTRGGVASTLGGKTPPILKGGGPASSFAADATLAPAFVASPAALTVGGSFEMLVAADVALGCRDLNVSLHGDFVNEGIYPSYYNYLVGTLNLDGTSPQTFEVAGIDVGETTDGFNLTGAPPHDLGPHTNYSQGIVRVSANSDVTFVNNVANTNSAGPCNEALYVDQFILKDGGTITLDNVRIYAAIFLGDRNAVVEGGDCGALLHVPLPRISGRCNAPIPTVSEWGLIALALLLAAAATVMLARRRLAQA